MIFPLSFNIFITGIMLKGNSDNLTVKTGFETQKKFYPYKVTLNGEITYGESKGIKNANSGKSLLSFDYYIFPKIEVFTFLMAEYDEMIRLKVRSNGGLGVKYDFLKDSLKEFSISTAVLRSYEEFFDLPPSWLYRLSIRPKVRISVGNLKVYGLVFYQPRIWKVEDFLIDASLSANLILSSRVSLRVEITDKYTSVVPEGVKNNDVKTLLGLNLSF